ncbi:alkaline phosphatase family protein [Patescibacteria group bacterium]|nr:alkaline phosphatase family protein [Patescibacteria group bacterium]MBU0963435.1 alkaline phosphatase family protein [Patescibacteria group bacterium]
MFIIGLDGATWDIIKPNIDKLPTFKKILSQHDNYTISLQQKPWSASVWCSMFSGKLPEEHNHLDFVKDGEVQTRNDVKVDFIWDILSRNNISVKALNIPFIVPPYNYNIYFNPPGYGVPLTQEELNTEITEITNKIVSVTGDSKPELFIAVYTALDKMSHLHWGGESLIDYYIKIDKAVNKIFELDEKVLILSDHGFTDYDKAPVQTLPKITSTGNELKGDHHPDAIAIAKNIPFKVNQPIDVFNGLISYFNVK